MNDETLINPILEKYKESFREKTYSEENNDTDVLMDIFAITPEQKRENRQYWGRELGMIWQLVVCKLSEYYCNDFKPALKIGNDEPCDLILGNDAIDTKYRIGSGDAGTLKKFKQYGRLLRDKGYTPVLLILREDNLSTAITACINGGWTVFTGDESFKYLNQKMGIDIKRLLVRKSGKFIF